MAGMAIRNFQVKNMICCDHSPQMLKIAKKRVCSLNVDFRETLIQDLQYDSDFDVITAILITHYLEYEDRIVSIRNCYHALKKNGLFFTVENFAPNNDIFKRFGRTLIRNRTGQTLFENFLFMGLTLTLWYTLK